MYARSMASQVRKPLAGCYVVSLRPVGGHDAMRRAAAALGARVLALSPWRIDPRSDAATRRDLRAALSADIVVATSPAAVRAAATLQPLRLRHGQAWCAVGSGTAAVLRRAGIDAVAAPERMDSEGLLALAELRSVRGRRVGLLTAPGGRDLIAPALRTRGAQVLRADVYDRKGIPIPPLAVGKLRRMRTRPWLALGSGEALQRTLAALPVDLATKLRGADVAAASARLAQVAREAGFGGRIVTAASARPRDLLAAIASAR